MFERLDVVTLPEKQIPDEYKRDRITDNKGRTLEGDWLEINRKQKIVKFRRKDGKLFDIAFAELCENDRRYAELETGLIWDIGEKPPVPHNLIIPYPKDSLDYPPICIEINSYHVYNDRIISAEMVGTDTVRVTVKSDEAKPRSTETTTTTDLPVEYLTASDREMIKKATNLDVPVVPRPSWTKENSQYWVSWEDKPLGDGKTGRGRIQYRFYEPMPTFKPDHIAGRIPMFRTAWSAMNQQFSLEEIYDHLRVKTLTSDIIYKFCDYRHKQIPEGNRRNFAYKSLPEVMKLLADAEPTKERITLKPKIDQSKVKLFEEKTPTELPGKPKFGEPNGPPLDGRLQSYFYIAQYLHVTKGKPKIPLADFLSNMEIRQIGRGDGGPGFLSFDEYEIHKSIEKSFGFKAWSTPSFYFGWQNRNLEEFHNLIAWKIVRHQIRSNHPVLVFKNDGFAILIGFTSEPGKEARYDAFMLEGASTLGTINETNLPYKVSEKTNVLQSEFPLVLSGLTFLE